MTRFILVRLGLCVAALCGILAARPVAAQVETQVPFDSAGRINAMTQPLVERLRLAAPEWPVTGPFERARLFASGAGFVLVVERGGGVVERIPLTSDQRAALKATVIARATGGDRGRVGAQTSIISEPAGSAFVRNQTLLGTFVYGPAAAVLVGDGSDDGSSALVAYSLVAGGATFAALARRRAEPPITVAQNTLATSMALGGAALGAAIPFIANADSAAPYGGGILAGSLAGTVAGLALGRRMTDAEASASGLGALLATGTAFGIMGGTGMLEGKEDEELRAPIALAAGAMVSGFVLGPYYPRRARYNVTAGDVSAVGWSGGLGALVAGIPFVDSGSDEQLVALGLTGGMIAGAVIGDALLARRRDHSTGDARLLVTGAGAGSLLLGGIASASDASPRVGYAMTAIGAVLGFAAAEAFVDPPRDGEIREASRQRQPLRTASVRRVTIDVDPVGAAFALSRQSGTFSVVRMTF